MNNTQYNNGFNAYLNTLPSAFTCNSGRFGSSLKYFSGTRDSFSFVFTSVSADSTRWYTLIFYCICSFSFSSFVCFISLIILSFFMRPHIVPCTVNRPCNKGVRYKCEWSRGESDEFYGVFLSWVLGLGKHSVGCFFGLFVGLRSDFLKITRGSVEGRKERRRNIPILCKCSLHLHSNTK